MKRMLSSALALLALLVLAPIADAALLGRLIGLSSNRDLYEVNPTTAALTPIGTVSENAGITGGLAYDPGSGTIFLTSTSEDSLFTLDLVTGNATLIGAYGVDVVLHGLEWDSSTGTLYGASISPTDTFYSISTVTGAATAIGGIGLLSFNNLGYDSTNNVMYLTNSDTDSLYAVNRATGAVALVGALGELENPNALAYASDASTMYLLDNDTDSLYTLNLTTGAATLIGSTGPGGNLLGLVYLPGAAVPEPGTLALLGLGLAGLAAVRRRKQ